MIVFFIVFLDSPNVNDDSEEEDSHTQQSDLDELIINEIQAHPLIWNKQSARHDKKKIV